MTFASLLSRRTGFTSSKSKPALPRALISPIEALERRVMLSISGASLEGPFQVTGTQWTYNITTAAGQSSNYFQKVIGPTTFNGIPCTEVDLGSHLQAKLYEGLDSLGDVVIYGSTADLGFGPVTDTYAPFQPGPPASLTAGAAQSFSYTDTNVSAPSGTPTTSVADRTDVITLMSETTTSITVPAGTYDAYELRDVISITAQGPGNTPTTSTEDGWYAPGIGLVKGISSDGNIDVLTKPPGHVDHLAFVPSPGNIAAGDTIDPAPSVDLLDSNGNLETSATDAVTVSITPASTGTGTLKGTLTVSAVGGIATFSDLSINKPGQYTLTATADGVTTSSGLFDITGGKLVLDVPPSDGTEATPLKPAVTVSLRDGQNNVITTDSTSTVTLNVFGNSASNKISGNTATLVAGVATFPNLQFGTTGFYKIQATDSNNDADVVSNRFKISGDHLVFLTSPKSSDVNTPLPVKVAIEDKKNHIDTTATSSIALSLNVVKPGNNAVLAGTTTLAFVKGVAAFTGVDAPTINADGTYTITATEEDDSTGVLAPTSTTMPITSGPKPFTIAGLHLMVKKPLASKVNVLEPFALTISLVDKKGRIDTSENSAQVQLSLNIVAGGDGAELQGTTTATFSNGVATFTAAAGPLITAGGKFTLTATEIGTNNTAASVDTKAITVVGYKLKLVPPLWAFVVDSPDLHADVVEVFALFDAQGDPVTSIAGLPDALATAQAISGDGAYSGTLQNSPSETYRNQLTNHNIADASVTAQANYAIDFVFTKTGTYKVKISPAPMNGSSVAPDLFQPLTVTCEVNNPSLAQKFSTVSANATNEIAVDIVKAPSQGTGDVFNDLTPSQNAGVHLALTKSQSGGSMLGDTDVPFSPEQIEYTTTDGENGEYGVKEAQFSVKFDRPGTYELTATELTSPEGQIFNAATASIVTTTTPSTFSVLVLPDKVAFVQQPPTPVTAGQPFTAVVALEDNDGNVLSNLDNSNEFPLYAVVTATSSQSGVPITVIDPVLFVSGQATLSNLILADKGVYRLHVELKEMSGGGFLFPLNHGLLASSDAFRIVAGS